MGASAGDEDPRLGTRDGDEGLSLGTGYGDEGPQIEDTGPGLGTRDGDKGHQMGTKVLFWGEGSAGLGGTRDGGEGGISG